MRTEDLKSGHRYGTCNGELVEPLSPVHARYALVTRRDDDGGETTTEIVELDEDSLKGKRSDPWSNCTPRWTQRATVGVKVRRWTTDDLDRNGDPLSDVEGEVIVIKPDDIKGTWKDYLVLHGEAVRRSWDIREAKRIREELADAVADRLRDLTGLEFDVDVKDYGTPKIRISSKELSEDEVKEWLA